MKHWLITIAIALLTTACGKQLYESIPEVRIDAPDIPSTICTGERRHSVQLILKVPDGEGVLAHPDEFEVVVTDGSFEENLLGNAIEELQADSPDKFIFLGVEERASSEAGYRISITHPNYRTVTIENVVVRRQRENREQPSCHVKTADLGTIPLVR